jgi:hypothetical protein
MRPDNSRTHITIKDTQIDPFIALSVVIVSIYYFNNKDFNYSVAFQS